MIAIVAVGYNRADSMKCLLQSLIDADYCDENVDLIISIDKGKNQDKVYDIALKTPWNYGKKVIRKFDERLGLRKHILTCGDLTNCYDAVVVLEDDLIVSPSFYKYVTSAVSYYSDDNRIAGISLYSYSTNEFSNSLFNPVYNGFDTYLMQVAQSWGQCWTKRMWKEFREWSYSDCDELPNNIADMPARIYNWGKTSWKKNYMAYIVSQDKFFVYPYHSYSTNKSEIGSHRSSSTSDYQVSLVEGSNDMLFRFPSFEQSIKYDVYFERINAKIYAKEFNNKKVCMDVYGLKTNFEGYDILFSCKALPFYKIKNIGLSFRPIEINCYRLSDGVGLFMYDLTRNDKAPTKKDIKLNRHVLYEYNTIAANWHFSFSYGVYGFIRAIKTRLLGKDKL